jgi:pseudouridine synthase
VQPSPEGTRVGIAIREGKKRQVRRMFSAVGHEVLALKRVRIGGLELGELPPGEWRALSEDEIKLLTESE